MSAVLEPPPALELAPAPVLRERVPLPAPPAPREPAPAPAPRRDVALDLLRGLAMVILVVNHIHLETSLEYATRALLSAAEVLVAVSGVVAGMVFGRRWLMHGARATALMLLRRARTLYVASAAVVALVYVLSFVPGLATEVLSVSPRRPDVDLYAFDGPLRTLLAIVTLEAGPWQFNILGFFIAAIAATPAVLWALARGWWPAVLAASWGLYVAGRTWDLEVLPSQSERPFPLLVWQVLFVNGMVLGFHRRALEGFARRHGRKLVAGVVVLGAAAAYLRLHGPGLDALLGVRDWDAWEKSFFHKASLDPARLTALVALTAAAYLALRAGGRHAERALGWLLLPLGRNSFYVFIVHVFVCLAVASVPFLAGDGLGNAANIAVQIGCLLAIWATVKRRVLFRWIPR